MRIPFVGPSFTSRSRKIDVSRTMNLFLEQGLANPQNPSRSPMSLVGTPGTILFGAQGTGPVRGLHYGLGQLISVSGNGVYNFNSTGVGTLIGLLTTYENPVSMADNGIKTAGIGGDQIMIVDGAHGYITDGHTLTRIPTTGGFVDGATSCCFMDGYFIANHGPDRMGFSVSNLYDGLTWNALAQSPVQAYPDYLQVVGNYNQQLWLIKQYDSEVWYNAAVPTSDGCPFLRISGGVIGYGIAAPASFALGDNSFFMLANQISSGGGNMVGVVEVSGYVPAIISPPPLTYAISKFARWDDAIGYVYSAEGHTFYVLTFPTGDRTFVYDASLINLHPYERWHERSGRTRRPSVADTGTQTQQSNLDAVVVRTVTPSAMMDAVVSGVAHTYNHWWWQQSIDVNDGRVLIIPQYYDTTDGVEDPDSGIVAGVYDNATDAWKWLGEVTGKYPSYGQPNTARLASDFAAFWAEFATVEPPTSVQTLTLCIFDGGATTQYDRMTWVSATDRYARDNTYDKMDVHDSGLIACAYFIYKEGGVTRNYWAIDSTPDKGATWNARYNFPAVSNANGYHRAVLRIDEAGTTWFAYSDDTGDHTSELKVYKRELGESDFTLVSTTNFNAYVTYLSYSVDSDGTYQYLSVELLDSSHVTTKEIHASVDSGVSFTKATTLGNGDSFIVVGDGENVIVPTYTPTEGFKVSDDYALTFAQIPGVAPMQDNWVDYQNDGPELIYSECSATFGDTSYLGMLYSNNYGQTWRVIPSPFTNDDSEQVIYE